MSSYRIRAVDGSNPEVSFLLHLLHKDAFGNSAALPDTNEGHWWLAYDSDSKPVAFAGLTKAYAATPAGYLKRSGVLRAHRGNGLQQRLIRVREQQARKNGWRVMLTDTTKNIPSANSLIREGYQLFLPAHPWAWDYSLYWRKDL
jgi:GNAT superfamily N-acetyltransferase